MLHRGELISEDIFTFIPSLKNVRNHYPQLVNQIFFLKKVQDSSIAHFCGWNYSFNTAPQLDGTKMKLLTEIKTTEIKPSLEEKRFNKIAWI